MFILRELKPVPAEFSKLHKTYNRGIIGVFEFLNKLIDAMAGPAPDSAKDMLKAYSDAVHCADLWTTPISVFMVKQDVSMFVEMFKNCNPTIGQHPPEWNSTPELNDTVQVLINQPNEDILAHLSLYATVVR